MRERKPHKASGDPEVQELLLSECKRLSGVEFPRD
jgi:hypothetical protein